MIVKLLTEHHLEYLGLKGDCTGSCKLTLVKMPHCWKTHATAQLRWPTGAIFVRRIQATKTDVSHCMVALCARIKVSMGFSD